MADCARNRPAGLPRLHAAVLNSGADENAEALLLSLQRLSTDREVFMAPFSPVMVAHTGSGLVGLGWWWES